jgi:hypothetical protein
MEKATNSVSVFFFLVFFSFINIIVKRGSEPLAFEKRNKPGGLQRDDEW